MNITQELISHVLRTPFRSLPEDIVWRAKEQIIDVVGCSIAGAGADGCPAMVEHINKTGGEKESTILAHRLKVPAHNAALANAIMARTIDYGTVEIIANDEVKPSHIAETLVPTAIAVAEQSGSSGREMLVALILGQDIAARIMAVSSPAHIPPEYTELSKTLGRGGIANILGAICVASRLSKQNEAQLFGALWAALDEICGKRGDLSSGGHFARLEPEITEKVGRLAVGLGLEAQLGIRATSPATRVREKDGDPLTGDGGYFPLFYQKYDPDLLTRDLGKKFHMEITFKAYPCCRANHGAIDCALEMSRKHRVEAMDIDEVTLIVSPWVRDFIVSIPFQSNGPPHFNPRLNAHQSLQYCVADAILRGEVKLEHFTDESIQDPRLAELIPRVRITSEGWPVFPNETFFQATILRVRMKNGQELSEHVNIPKGSEIHSPLTKEEKREKFRSNVRFSKRVALRDAEKALSMLEHLEKIEDIRKVFSLL